MEYNYPDIHRRPILRNKTSGKKNPSTNNWHIGLIWKWTDYKFKENTFLLFLWATFGSHSLHYL